MHIFHSWAKWEPYIWKGLIIRSFFGKRETPIQVTEDREKRSCLVCGKTQDRLIEGN